MSYYDYDHYPLLSCRTAVESIFDFTLARQETGWSTLEDYISRFEVGFVQSSYLKRFELDQISKYSDRFAGFGDNSSHLAEVKDASAIKPTMSSSGLGVAEKTATQSEDNESWLDRLDYYNDESVHAIQHRRLRSQQYACDATFTRIFTCRPEQRSAMIKLCADLWPADHLQPTNHRWSAEQLTALASYVHLADEATVVWSVTLSNGVDGTYHQQSVVGHFIPGALTVRINDHIMFSPADWRDQHTVCKRVFHDYDVDAITAATATVALNDNNTATVSNSRIRMFDPQPIPNHPFILIPASTMGMRPHYTYMAIAAALQGVTPSMTLVEIHQQVMSNVNRLM